MKVAIEASLVADTRVVTWTIWQRPTSEEQKEREEPVQSPQGRKEFGSVSEVVRR